MEQYPFCSLPREINITGLVSAFRVQREQNYYFNGESHDFYELVYVVNGKAGITAGERVYILEKGQCFLHPPMEFHKIWSEDSTTPELIIFSFCAKQMPEQISGRYILSPGLRMMLEEWMDENNVVFHHNDILVTGIKDFAGVRRQLSRLELFFAELFSTAPDLQRIDSGSAAAYTEIVRIMKENIDQSLTVEQLSSLCRMSKSNMKRIFSRYSGIGIISYFNQMKINRACEILLQGETVGTTSRLLGFTDQNYFSTVFRRITGMSPSVYANQSKDVSK